MPFTYEGALGNQVNWRIRINSLTRSSSTVAAAVGR